MSCSFEFIFCLSMGFVLWFFWGGFFWGGAIWCMCICFCCYFPTPPPYFRKFLWFASSPVEGSDFQHTWLMLVISAMQMWIESHDSIVLGHLLMLMTWMFLFLLFSGFFCMVCVYQQVLINYAKIIYVLVIWSFGWKFELSKSYVSLFVAPWWQVHR